MEMVNLLCGGNISGGGGNPTWLNHANSEQVMLAKLILYSFII